MRELGYRLQGLPLSQSKPPYSSEHMPELPPSFGGPGWLIVDSEDSMVGHAPTECGARKAVRRLNGGGAPKTPPPQKARTA